MKIYLLVGFFNIKVVFVGFAILDRLGKNFKPFFIREKLNNFLT